MRGRSCGSACKTLADNSINKNSFFSAFHAILDLAEAREHGEDTGARIVAGLAPPSLRVTRPMNRESRASFPASHQAQKSRVTRPINRESCASQIAILAPHKPRVTRPISCDS